MTGSAAPAWCARGSSGCAINPAYKGTACFGKMEIRPRQRVTRPLRMRGGVTNRNSANHERPRKEWIEIPVPAIVSEETFALAQELLTANKTSTSHDSTQHLPRDGIVQQVRLCALQNISTHERAEDLLLSLPRYRWVEVSQRCSLQ